MAKGIDTNTIVMIGGLGLLGFGMFYMMNKQSDSMEQRIAAATAAATSQAGVSNPAIMSEMRAQIAQFAQQSQGMTKWEKQQAENQLTAQYVGMGIQGAAAIVSAIGSFF